MTDYLYASWIYVYEIELPEDTDEAVTENADGTATIFIRRDLCDKKKREMVIHAAEHILRGDFSVDAACADDIELRGLYEGC